MSFYKIDSKGFTLIEIMIVIVIIGIATSLVVPNLLRARQEMLEDACIVNMRHLYGAAALAYSEDELNFSEKNILYWYDLETLTPKYIEAIPECPYSGRISYYVHLLESRLIVQCLYNNPDTHNVMDRLFH